LPFIPSLEIVGRLHLANKILGKPKDVVNMVELSKAEELAPGGTTTLAAPDLPLLQLQLQPHQLEPELEKLLAIGIVASLPAHGQAKLQ
jgi:hypothetical protein